MMRTILALVIVLISNNANAAFTCEANGNSCPGKLCVKNNPDHCVQGLRAFEQNNVIILQEESPGSSKGFKEFIDKNRISE